MTNNGIFCDFFEVWQKVPVNILVWKTKPVLARSHSMRSAIHLAQKRYHKGEKKRSQDCAVYVYGGKLLGRRDVVIIKMTV